MLKTVEYHETTFRFRRSTGRLARQSSRPQPTPNPGPAGAARAATAPASSRTSPRTGTRAGALWKTEIPGQGHASAIVWGDRVCTVTGLPATKERVLLCLDRASGKILWQQTVVQGPLEKLNKENSHASGTPATDGERVYVAFRVGDEIVVAAHELAERQTALAGPAGDARRRVGIQQ